MAFRSKHQISKHFSLTWWRGKVRLLRHGLRVLERPTELLDVLKRRVRITDFADTLMAMTSEQGHKLFDQMQAIEAQNQALLAQIEAGRQREAAAAQVTADERRAREVA